MEYGSGSDFLFFQLVDVVSGFMKSTYTQVVALKHFISGDFQFNPLRVVLILGILAFAYVVTAAFAQSCNVVAVRSSNYAEMARFRL